MEILRSFWALLAGFATMELLIAGVTLLLLRGSSGWAGTPSRPSPQYVAANLSCSFLAAAAGGYVCAWIAVNGPLHTVLMLAIVVLAFGAITSLQMRGLRPAWYQVVLLVLCALGVMAGGLLRLKLAGFGGW